jgi:hypothetical protein
MALRFRVVEAPPTARSRSWLLPVPVRHELIGAAVRLAISGLIAIGLSGFIAGAMGFAFDKSFVSGDPPEISYSKSRCADYFEYEPKARSCEEAATLHHFGETVWYRATAGVAGILLLGAYLRARRRWTWLQHRHSLPPGFEATVGASLFGLAALALLAQSLNQFALRGTNGAGAYLSAGLVAAVVALAYGLSVYRTLAAPCGDPRP